MITLTRRVLVDRDPDAAWELVSDFTRYPEFFVGISRWEPRSSKRRGKGAKFRVLMRVGSVEAGGTIAITGWEPQKTIAWTSDAGVQQRGAWTLLPAAGGTQLQLEIEFDLAGPAGWLAERLAGRVVGRNMEATLLAARRILEFESKDGAPKRKPRASSPQPAIAGR
jgi:ribosome-associated toxin RatA of RatAB toxin-antitoxin module